MRIVRMVLVGLILSSVIHASICVAEIVSIKAPKANIRSGPGTRYKILWSVGKFYPLQVLKRKGKWYRVRDFEGDVGWVYRKATSKIPAVVVKVRQANIRSGPGAQYQVDFFAERGTAFQLIKQVGNWIQIRHLDGDMGWIFRSLVWGR